MAIADKGLSEAHPLVRQYVDGMIRLFIAHFANNKKGVSAGIRQMTLAAQEMVNCAEYKQIADELGLLLGDMTV